jgi:putative transposase
MNCPDCLSPATRQQRKKTALGYRTFRCSACQRTFNERTGTPFNFLEYPTDIVLLTVLWRLRYKLSLRDLAEMFLERGFSFTHEAVRDWEERFAPLFADQLRRKRRGHAGKSWYVDETYVKVHGKWCYLYRAIDRDGNRGRFTPERETRYGGSKALLSPSCCWDWACSRTGDDRWTWHLTTCSARDDWQ